MSKAIPISVIVVAACATILFIVIATTPGYYHANANKQQSFGAFRSCVLIPKMTALSVPHQMHTKSSISRKLLQAFPGGGSFPGGSFPGGNIPSNPGGSFPGGNIPSNPGGSIPGFPGGSIPGGNIPVPGGNIPGNIPGIPGTIPGIPGTIPGTIPSNPQMNICTLQPSLCTNGGVPRTDICTIQPSACTGGVPDVCKISPSSCTGGGDSSSSSSSSSPSSSPIPIAACRGLTLPQCAEFCYSNPTSCGTTIPTMCIGLTLEQCSMKCQSNPSACISDSNSNTGNNNNNNNNGGLPSACSGLTIQQCTFQCQSNPSLCQSSNDENQQSFGQVPPCEQFPGGCEQRCENLKECKGSGCEKINATRAFLLIGLVMAAVTTVFGIFYLVASPGDIFYYIGASFAIFSAISSLICMSIVASDIPNQTTLYYGFGFHVVNIVFMAVDAGLIIISAKYKGNQVAATMNKL